MLTINLILHNIIYSNKMMGMQLKEDKVYFYKPYLCHLTEGNI